jgi:hypothetical protein
MAHLLCGLAHVLQRIWRLFDCNPAQLGRLFLDIGKRRAVLADGKNS